MLLQYEVSWMPYREACSWLEPAVETAETSLQEKTADIDMTDYIRALRSLGWLLVTHGDMFKGHAVLDECISLARRFGEFQILTIALSMKAQAMVSNVTGEIIAQLEEVIDLCRQKDYELGLAMALYSVGQAYLFKGEFEKGQKTLAEVVDLVEKLGILYVQAWVYYVLATQARLTGDTSEAERYYWITIESNEKLGNQRLKASGRSELAHMYRQEGRLDEAAAIYRQTILSWQEQGHQAAVAHQLECFAYIALVRQSFAYAAQLLGAAQMARERTNSPSTEQQEIDEKQQALRRLEAEIGATELDRLTTKGKSMSLDEAVVFALEGDE
jgi:tetratricopeptide (TPR) repeat protein